MAIVVINFFNLNSFFFGAGTGKEVVPATSKLPARLVSNNLIQIHQSDFQRDVVSIDTHYYRPDIMNYSFRFLNETNKSRLGRARKSIGMARPPTIFWGEKLFLLMPCCAAIHTYNNKNFNSIFKATGK